VSSKTSILILDFNKPEESRACLESVEELCQFNKNVVFLSNGGNQDYVWELYKDGLIDFCIFSRENEGLGLGTSKLFNFSPDERVLALQNDQIVGRPISQKEVDSIFDIMSEQGIPSISIAGGQCGNNIYSERAHFTNKSFYLGMEKNIPLGRGGAGPYHDEIWREESIQGYYEENHLAHITNYPAAVIDNGRSAVRENPDGSVWKHLPDTKQLWLIGGPVKEKFVYPKFTEKEWDEVISSQSWPDGKAPELQVESAFKVPHWHG